MMTKTVKSGLALATSLAVLGLASPAAAQTRVLLNCFFPPQHFICQTGLKGWADSVRDVTDGRVTAVVLPQSMAAPGEQLVSVRANVFDAAIQMNGFITNEVIGTQLGMMPFTGGADARANSVALWRTHERFMTAADEYEGVELLGLFVAPGADFYSLDDRPILSVDDVAGRKVWAAAGTAAEILIAAGSPVVSGPAVQMTELIQRGVVDGFVGIPAADARAFNVLPSALSVTQTDRKILTPTFSFIISDAKWNEISPEDQDAIRSVSGEAFAELIGGLYTEAEISALASLAEDVEIIDADSEFEGQLLGLAQPKIDEWVKAAAERNIDSAGALDFYVREVGNLTQQ